MEMLWINRFLVMWLLNMMLMLLSICLKYRLCWLCLGSCYVMFRVWLCGMMVILWIGLVLGSNFVMMVWLDL